MGAHDDDVAPWLPATRDLLASAAGEGTPTLGHLPRRAAAGGRLRRARAGRCRRHRGRQSSTSRWRPEAGSDALPPRRRPGLRCRAGAEHAPRRGRRPAAGRGLAGRLARVPAPGVPGRPPRLGRAVPPRGVAADVTGLGRRTTVPTGPGWGLDGDAVVAQLVRRDARGRARRAAAGRRFAALLRQRPGRALRRSAVSLRLARSPRPSAAPAGTVRVPRRSREVRRWVRRPPHRRPAPPLRIALLSYRSKPHSGGQGVYVRHLSRELAALGHDVEVLSGPPYPELDDVPGVRAHAGARAWTSTASRTRSGCPPGGSSARRSTSSSSSLMCTAAFPEPLTFSLRAAPRAAPPRPSGPTSCTTTRHSATACSRCSGPASTSSRPATTRSPSTAGTTWPRARGLGKRVSIHRWYSFLRMQGRVLRAPAGRAHRVALLGRRHLPGLPGARGRLTVVPVGVDSDVFVPPDRAAGPRAGSSRPPAPTCPLKGLVPAARGGRQAAHRARRRAGRRRQGPRGRQHGGHGRAARASPAHVRFVAGRRRDRAGRAVRLGRGRRRARACTRGSACPRSR